jgi:hypothetical protein
MGYAMSSALYFSRIIASWQVGYRNRAGSFYLAERMDC